MRLKFVAATFAAVGALALLAAPADAQQKKKRVTYDTRGNTVFTSRDENGRTRTRIIIQKRSYLDPGTEVLPGSRNDQGYAFSPNQRPVSVLDNTAFGSNQSALPDNFTLTGKSNPFLRF
jgi:hypothetical protein